MLIKIKKRAQQVLIKIKNIVQNQLVNYFVTGACQILDKRNTALGSTI